MTRHGEKDGQWRATAHKELSRPAFHHFPQHSGWEHTGLGGGWFNTGESHLHTIQRGPLVAVQGRWHHAAMTGRSVNRSCRQQAGWSHLPHCSGSQEGTRGWDHGKTTLHLQAASPPLGSDVPSGPQSHPLPALAHCSHQGFPHNPAEVEHKKKLN